MPLERMQSIIIVRLLPNHATEPHHSEYLFLLILCSVKDQYSVERQYLGRI